VDDLKWEILVVDNNCSDGTSETVLVIAKSFPVPLRLLVEKKQGVSNARNLGITESRGRYLMFTDDDVRPRSNWIETTYATFKNQRCDGVAGRIDLEWNCSRPKWLTDDLLGFLAALDYGDEECQLANEDCTPFGPNMAFTREVFQTIGNFNPSLGRTGGSLAGGEEPELFQRFVRAGLRMIYQPNSVVEHVVNPGHVRKSFFRSVHYLSGKESGMRNAVSQGKRLLGVPLYLIPQLGRSLRIFLRTTMNKGYRYSLRKEMTVWYFLGFILGCHQRYRLPR
jgi:glycosyltransferase involved in cell wall biosynthesis